MAKIYETIDDVHRNDLVKKAGKAREKASEGLSLSPFYLVIGGLAHMVNQAKPVMTKTSNSKLWEMFGRRHAVTTTCLQWFGYGASAGSIIMGAIYKLNQNKAEKELAALGPEKEIIKLSDGVQIELPDDTEYLKKYFKQTNKNAMHQADTVIQTDTLKLDFKEQSRNSNILMS